MVLVTTRTEVKFSGEFFQPQAMENRLLKAANIIGNQVENVAKADYLSKKKKTPKLPSMIIDSFSLGVPTKKGEQVAITVFAGGPSAPHLIWVDQPRKLRNGKVWSGYKFIDTGIVAGSKIAPDAVKEAFKGL